MNSIRFSIKRTIIIIMVLTLIMAAFVMCSCGKSDEGENQSTTQIETYSEEEKTTESIAETQRETQSETPKETMMETQSETPKETTLETQTEALKETTTEIQVPTKGEEPSTELTLEEKVQAKLSSMTLEEKIYQMMIVMPEQLTGEGTVTSAGAEVKDAIRKYPVGGIIYFPGNLLNPSQTRAMIANTKQYGMEVNGLPLFMCIDEEGGRVARIGNNPVFGVKTFSNMWYIGSAAGASTAGSTIGAYLKQYGFNVDFAPNADVLTNPQAIADVENHVIGERSFGSDPVVVKKRALAFAQGLKSQGILATYKHFPGHGATVGDTHEGFAYTDKTLEELMESELVPFKSAAANNIDFVMVGHISVPKVVGDNTPSTLSYKLVTEVLKKQLGYNGLIVTDSLIMQAVTKVYSGEQIAVMAVKAGNDILLMPKDLSVAVNAIKEAVKSEEISENRINESVKKILRVKMSM